MRQGTYTYIIFKMFSSYAVSSLYCRSLSQSIVTRVCVKSKIKHIVTSLICTEGLFKYFTTFNTNVLMTIVNVETTMMRWMRYEKH